jgi:ferric-dicitrate binding protein FerR (iron transport regulator)
MAAAFAALFVLSLLLAASAAAQDLPGCNARRASDPPRTVVDCDGTVIEYETAAALGIVPRDDGGTVLLEEGAVLVEAGGTGPDFQIRTPHAIASVRGTVFAVEVTAEGTAVFAAEGRVRVRRFGGIDSVTLSAGQGVDVAPGEPLVTRRWGAARVEALLARFGR